ncbi:transposase [Alkalithermobacter thermoalcaliphilus JW-YL-7 = DSM 7308]|jgi:transposase|uniref:Transposase n=2 Tax=Clostridium paradoxum TaxID=29346 RepID=A0A150FSI9_CLOPD|nr:transposase IS3/IS911 family protein [[Clostridium] paradoxum JW-YL-7 = DSM 7308]SHK70342.1 transposase [[Clostridium] paradoxum JW-YL-7 = DSM 7308]
MSERRTFTEEFKTMITELVASGQSVKEVAREYSLSETSIRNWVKKKAPIKTEEGTINLEEINRIKKENARLKEENEILKKAMAIFAKK